MASNFAISTIFRAIDNMTAPLTRMALNVNRFAGAADRSLRRVRNGLTATGAALESGIKATTAAAASSGAAIAKITSTGADYEQQLVNAAAKFPTTIKQGTAAFDELDAAAAKIGATTEFTASQAASAINFLAMAGFDAKGALGALPLTVDMATASSIDLAEATDIASDALGQFNMFSKDAAVQSKNLSRIIDVMTKAATTANTTVPLLFETFKDAAPVAAGIGDRIETVAAMAGTLANAGIKGATAGTALKLAYVRLSAPTGDTAKLLFRLGIKTRDTSENMLDMYDILGSLNKRLAGMGTARRAEILKAIFGDEALSASNVLLANVDAMREYRKQLDGAAGSTATLASIMRSTTQADINGMWSAVEGLTIAVFKLNKDAIREGVQSVTAWVRSLSDAVGVSGDVGRALSADVFKWVKRCTVALIALAAAWVAVKVATIATTAAIGVFRGVVIAVTASMWLWSTAGKALTGALALMRAGVLALNIAMYANPIGLIIAAFAALGVAVAAAVVYWDDLVAAFKRIPAPILGVLALITGPIGWFVGAGALIMKNWEPLKKFFEDLWSDIIKMFNDAMTYSLPVIDKIARAFGVITDAIGLTENAANPATPLQWGAVGAAGAAVVRPDAEIVRAISDNKSSAEITLRNQSNAPAELTYTRGAVSLDIINSGGF